MRRSYAAANLIQVQNFCLRHNCAIAAAADSCVEFKSVVRCAVRIARKLLAPKLNRLKDGELHEATFENLETRRRIACARREWLTDKNFILLLRRRQKLLLSGLFSFHFAANLEFGLKYISRSCRRLPRNGVTEVCHFLFRFDFIRLVIGHSESKRFLLNSAIFNRASTSRTHAQQSYERVKCGTECLTI